MLSGRLPAAIALSDLGIEPALERQRIMREPFILRGPLPGRDQDRHFAQARRQRGIPAQIFRHRRQPRRQIGVADIGAIGRVGEFRIARRGRDHVGPGLLRRIQFLRLQRRKAGDILGAACLRHRNQQPPARWRRAVVSWFLSLMDADFRRIGLCRPAFKTILIMDAFKGNWPVCAMIAPSKLFHLKEPAM